MRGSLFFLASLLVFSLQSFASPDDDLSQAASEGEVRAVRAALEAEADVNTSGYFGRTPLMEAAWKGHTEVVQILIEAGAELDTGDMMWTTALGYAAGEGHTEVVQALLEAGADVNFQGDGEVWTALIHAAEGGHDEVVRLLVDAGALLELNRHGTTALMYAAGLTGEGHIAVVQILLEAGAEVSWRDEDGKTALMYAKEADHPDIVERLIDAGARE